MYKEENIIGLLLQSAGYSNISSVPLPEELKVTDNISAALRDEAKIRNNNNRAAQIRSTEAAQTSYCF